MQNDGDVIMNAGNVGIGTSSPSVPLEIVGAISGGGQLKVSSNTQIAH